MKANIRDAPAGSLVAIPDFLTPAELDAVGAYGDRLTPKKAEIAGRKDDDTDYLRVTRIAWMERGSGIEWLHARIEQTVLDLNARLYRYELYGLVEPLQYTIYNGNEGGHYGWHVDTGVTVEPRKLSLTLQLSEPSAYEGGELILQAGEGPYQAERARGTLIVFPSFLMHRVTPVTSGIRKSLVAWVAGPAFR